MLYKQLKNNKAKYLIIIPIIILLLSRLLPFILHGPHPLGYDTGFYHHSLQEQRKSLDNYGLIGNIKQINQNIDMTESIGSRFITNIMITAGLSNQAILYWFYILLSLCSGILIYLISKRYFGQNSALLAIFLYSLSTVQYATFTHILWKNNIGIFLILLSFYLIEIMKSKKKYFLMFSYTIVVSLILIVTHRTSAFIFLVSLTLYFLISSIKKQYKVYLISLIAILAGILFALNFNQLLDAYNDHDRFNLQKGSFMDWYEYLLYSITYLPLACYTAWKSHKEGKYTTVISLFIVTLILTICHFLFYQRLFIFLDLAVIILAAPAIIKLGEYFKVKKTYWLIGSIIFYTAILAYPIISYQPLISERKLLAIKELQTLPSYFRVFTDNSDDISWLYGFSGHTVIGPGWHDSKQLNNNWSYERWQLYWRYDINTKQQFLKELNKKIIINTEGKLKNIEAECLDQFNNNFALFKCPK